MTTIQRYSGEEIRVLTVVKDSDGKTVDLAGLKSAEFCIFQDRRCAICMLSKSYPDGGISIPSTSDGQLLASINPEDTLHLTGQFYWKMDITIGNKKATVADGMIRIKGKK